VCGLYIVGSSLNGFGTSRSDLDLCLMITQRDVNNLLVKNIIRNYLRLIKKPMQ